MKSFNQLSIGDEIFSIEKNPSFLDYKDAHGNGYTDQIYSTHKIVRLEHDKNGQLEINNSDSHYSGYRCLLVIPVNYQDEKRITMQKGTTFFVNREDAFDIAREILLKAMEDRHAIANQARSKALEEIRQIREKYFFILNPSLMPTLSPEP